MITQAIKRWLSQMFAWWPWRSSANTECAPTSNSLNKGAIQGTTTWPTTDGVGVASQPEIAPRRPTIEEWPERIVQPSPPALEERTESLPPPPAEKAGEAAPGAHEAREAHEDRAGASPAPTFIAPTPEKHLEFLRFLVKRGILNEGFDEGKVPEQYKREP